MRTIKFRAWDGQKMVNDWLVLSESYTMIIATNRAFAAETVMQFTGLLDKNKNEIYEGDILEVKLLDKYNTDVVKAVIKWYQPEASFHLEEKTSHGFRYWGTQQMEWCLVIGNIHENPEY